MSTLQQTPIEQFKLPRKLIRILHRNKIQTFGDLQDIVNQGHLLRLRHVGRKIAGELTRLATHISTQPDLYLATANQNNVNGGENTPQAQNKSELLIKLDQVNVEKLELHPKIIHALTRAGICTIGDLLLIQPSQLSQIHRIGLKAAREIPIALDKALNSPEKYIE
jgi:DNA-directed RNA polymerase alpha subunit